MKINKIDLKSMTNDKHFQFHAEIITLIKEIGVDILKIAATIWAAHLDLFDKLDAALKKIVMSAETEKIHAADKARDELYSGFVKMVAALCEHYDPAIRDAALKVQVVIHTYGNVAAKPLNEETSAIYNLVQELKSDKYKDLIALLNLTEWVNNIEEANNTCEEHVQERDRENAGKTHTAVKGARRALDNSYKDIVDMLNAHLLLKQLEGCESFVDTMNEIIRRFSIKRRKHHHGAHGAGAETSEEGDAAEADGNNA